MNLRQSIKPLSQLKAEASEIFRDIAANRRTYVITQNGEPKAVVQDIASYEADQETLAMLKLLAQSAKSVEAGRVKPLKQAFRDIRKRVEGDK
jgi:prevent-host-death family protein